MKQLWAYADECTPADRAANYTQAIMDLGATICTRGKPDCGACPLTTNCLAFKNDLTAAIPAPKPRAKKPRPQKSAVLLMAVNSRGEVLLEKRPPSGIWGGLWSFPELQSAEQVDGWCTAELGLPAENKTIWPDVMHSFSHFDFAMQPIEVRLSKSPAAVMEGDRWLWYNTRSPADIGLAAPVARLLQSFDERAGEQ